MKVLKEVGSSNLLKLPQGRKRVSRWKRHQENVDEILAAALRLSRPDQAELVRRLQAELDANSAPKETEYFLVETPPGTRISVISGSMEERSRYKTDKKGVEHGPYTEIWFHWEVSSGGERSHRSRYVCQYPEGKNPKPEAARKINILQEQLANNRPYPETLEKLGFESGKKKEEVQA